MADRPKRDWAKQLASSAKTAEELIVARGEILQTFILHCEDAERLIIAPFRNEKERRVMLQGMSLMALHHNAEGLTIMAEAWMASYTGPTDEDARAQFRHRPIRDEPNRKEVVIVSLVHFEGRRRTSISCMREIVRNAAGKVTGLGEEEVFGQGVEMGGEMVDILPPAWPSPPKIRELAGEMLKTLSPIMKMEIVQTVHAAGHA
jgi:hypothetical protein